MATPRNFTTISLPEELKIWLAERANKNRRSRSMEIIYILEKYRAEDAKKLALEAAN